MKKYAMKAVIDDKLPRHLSDLSATRTKVKALKPDMLVVSGYAKGASRAAPPLNEMNIGVPLVAFSRCESADLAAFYGHIKFWPAGNNIAKPMVLRQIQSGKYNVVAASKWASHKLVDPRAAK